MKRHKFTPEVITELASNEVFVFGSNTQGRHGSGAARAALLHFGAVYGEPEGLMGQSYALITTDLTQAHRYPLPLIEEGIEKLYKCASEHTTKVFYVTKIACGLAGYDIPDIAHLFKGLEHLRPENVILPIEFS